VPCRRPSLRGGQIRTPHPVELGGEEWYEWLMEREKKSRCEAGLKPRNPVSKFPLTPSRPLTGNCDRTLALCWRWGVEWLAIGFDKASRSNRYYYRQ
jgi:hypothetical protein